MNRFVRATLAWLAATLTTAVLGSLFHTHHTLSALRALGVNVPPATQWHTRLLDLQGFAPGYAGLTAGGFLVAFLIAGLLRRRWPGRRPLWFATAGAASQLAMVGIMQLVFGLTALAIARTAGGIGLLMLAGAAGGTVFALLSVTPRSRSAS